MQRAYARLILTLVIAGALSCLAGLLFTQVIARVPCQGEGLACNIDEAVGMLIYAVLGPIIFAVTLGIARNRRALAGATIVLVAPLLVFFGVDSIETWRYVGFDAYTEWRKFLVTFMPPILAVLVQSLIVRAVTGSDRKLDQFSREK
jgi:uncharacterized membrane-anchored protein YitT (DUF2179 family)